MPSWFRKKIEEIDIKDAIKSGPYIPPPTRENEGQTADVPPDFEPLFSKAEENVATYFDDMDWDHDHGLWGDMGCN